MKRWLFLIPLFASSLAFAACGEQFVDGQGDCVTGITADSGGTTTGETITLDGTGGIVTTRSGNTIAIDGSGVASPPGGSNTQVQYNDGGVFGGDSYFDYNETSNRLSVFGTLGSEVVSNGTFTGSASGWTVGSGYAYSSNTVVKNSNGTAALTQTLSAYVLREYLLTYTISNWTVGTVTPTVTGGSLTGTAVGANGTYTERFIAATSNGVLTFTPSNTARFTIDSVSVKPLKGTNTASNINTGGLSIEGEWSNGSPGTTRGMTVNNDGSNSWTDYRFAGTLRSAIGATSSGEVSQYASGGNYFSYYYGNSGLTSNSMFNYNYPTAFVHYGGGWFSSNVMAGATYAPTSTFQTKGSTALEIKRITSSQSIDGTATIWLSDATTAAACTGTPSSACSSWGNQTDCEKWDAHGACAWNAGTSCSVYDNESGMGTCSGTSGCTVVTASCSGGYDESSCISQDDSYGGSCSWDGTDCSGIGDEGTCGSTTGCSTNYSDCSSYNDNYGGCTGQSGCTSSSSTDCSAYDGTDQSTCEANSGCYWDGMSNCYMTCSGSYYTGCTGTYYTCNGNYNTGSCSGTYGSGCTGTSSCSGIDDSTNCGLETGCTWSSVLNLTLPDGESSPHRNYWIYNDATGGADTIVYPYAGQTVDATSSTVLSAYKDRIHIAYYKQTKDCSVYNEGACTPSGCSKNYSYCSWNSGDNTCYGDASCTGIGDQSTCESTQYYASCSGTEIIRKNWYKIGS